MSSPPKKKQKQAPKASPADRLLAAGLRVTYVRVQVLELLDQASRPASHGDIEALASVPIDKVTLYRTLDRLVEAKLLRRTVGEDRVTRFSPLSSGEHDEHAHFHCDDCGKVYCLEMKVPKTLKVPEGFAVETLDLHGHCSNCKR